MHFLINELKALMEHGQDYEIFMDPRTSQQEAIGSFCVDDVRGDEDFQVTQLTIEPDFAKGFLARAFIPFDAYSVASHRTKRDPSVIHHIDQDDVYRRS